MRNSDVVKILLNTLLIITLSVIMIWGISHTSFRKAILKDSFIDDASTIEPADMRDEDYSIHELVFDADKVDEIDLDWVTGEVEIRTHKDNTIIITEKHNKTLDPDRRMHTYLEGDNLNIKFAKPEIIRHWNITASDYYKYLTVTVPEDKMFDDIEVNNVSSDVNIEKILSEEFNFENVSGSIDIGEIHAEECTLESISGSMKVKNINSDELDIRGVSGDVSVHGNIGAIKGDMVSGKFSLELDSLPESIKINTVSGNTDISLPENDGFEILVDGLKKNMNSDFSITMKDGKMIYKDGGPKIKLSAVSGKLNIHKKD